MVLWGYVSGIVVDCWCWLSVVYFDVVVLCMYLVWRGLYAVRSASIAFALICWRLLSVVRVAVISGTVDPCGPGGFKARIHQSQS